MKILSFTKYSYEGPSSRYRFYNYQKCFQRDGIEMVIKPLFSKSYFQTSNKVHKACVVAWSYLQRIVLLTKLLVSKEYNLIVIEYELLPFLPALFEYMLKKRGIKYIVDYDDAIFHKYDMSGNKLIQILFKNKIANVIKYADYVIVCNAYLESYAKEYNQNTFRLPTVVLLDKYKKKMETFKKKENNPFIIGWIGSRTTSVYILKILPAIKKFVETYPNVRLYLVAQ